MYDTALQLPAACTDLVDHGHHRCAFKELLQVVLLIVADPYRPAAARSVKALQDAPGLQPLRGIPS